ncbi:Peptidase S24/S26A/S26B, conserved region [Methanocaldococcus infernus ME]|uniref:Peptidase S24/S26A/S26B, conserved region n=1 Tax=Methanocaldococcus infernus (strain DSM 11812 / JCM 15783 / ME) TaxID=573063 RepID=D5VSU8_METIM|nr:S26 family signal peptidase [Methanocaldococcus infernus]ADG13651.1 Peptidase S24/S26A/S26B, conserved region [Methanocaldococcus infernus ME]
MDKKELTEWIIFLVILFLIWSHVNVVVSNSMYPVLKRGDLVIVENAGLEFNPKDVKVGDIVIYNAHWPAYEDIIFKIDERLGERNILYIFSEGNLEAKYLGNLNSKLGIFKVFNLSVPQLYEKPVIHRVRDKVQFLGKDYLIIKGDNNPIYDPELVSLSQIRQRVVTINGYPLVIPYVGYLSIYAKEYWYLIVLGIALYYLYNYLRGRK